MKKSSVTLGLTDVVAGADILAGYYPNIEPAPELASATEYLDVTFVSSRRSDGSLKGNGAVREVGIMQVAVAVPERTGSTTAEDYADKVAALFVKGARMPITGGNITITEAPDIKNGYPVEAEWRVPVIISYSALSS